MAQTLTDTESVNMEYSKDLQQFTKDQKDKLLELRSEFCTKINKPNPEEVLDNSLKSKGQCSRRMSFVKDETTNVFGENEVFLTQFSHCGSSHNTENFSENQISERKNPEKQEEISTEKRDNVTPLACAAEEFSFNNLDANTNSLCSDKANAAESSGYSNMTENDCNSIEEKNVSSGSDHLRCIKKSIIPIVSTKHDNFLPELTNYGTTDSHSSEVTMGTHFKDGKVFIVPEDQQSLHNSSITDSELVVLETKITDGQEIQFETTVGAEDASQNNCSSGSLHFAATPQRHCPNEITILPDAVMEADSNAGEKNSATVNTTNLAKQSLHVHRDEFKNSTQTEFSLTVSSSCEDSKVGGQLTVFDTNTNSRNEEKNVTSSDSTFSATIGPCQQGNNSLAEADANFVVARETPDHPKHAQNNYTNTVLPTARLNAPCSKSSSYSLSNVSSPANELAGGPTNSKLRAENTLDVESYTSNVNKKYDLKVITSKGIVESIDDLVSVKMDILQPHQEATRLFIAKPESSASMVTVSSQSDVKDQRPPAQFVLLANKMQKGGLHEETAELNSEKPEIYASRVTVSSQCVVKDQRLRTQPTIAANEKGNDTLYKETAELGTEKPQIYASRVTVSSQCEVKGLRLHARPVLLANDMESDALCKKTAELSNENPESYASRVTMSSQCDVKYQRLRTQPVLVANEIESDALCEETAELGAEKPEFYASKVTVSSQCEVRGQSACSQQFAMPKDVLVMEIKTNLHLSSEAGCLKDTNATAEEVDTSEITSSVRGEENVHEELFTNVLRAKLSQDLVEKQEIYPPPSKTLDEVEHPCLDCGMSNELSIKDAISKCTKTTGGRQEICFSSVNISDDIASRTLREGNVELEACRELPFNDILVTKSPQNSDRKKEIALSEENTFGNDISLKTSRGENMHAICDKLDMSHELSSQDNLAQQCLLDAVGKVEIRPPEWNKSGDMSGIKERLNIGHELPTESTSLFTQCLPDTDDKKGIGPSEEKKSGDISLKTLEENKFGVHERLDMYYESPVEGTSSLTQCSQDKTAGDISLKTLEEENKLDVDEVLGNCHDLPVDCISSLTQCLQNTDDNKGIGLSEKKKSGDIFLKTLEEENKLDVDVVLSMCQELPTKDSSLRQCSHGTDKKGTEPSGENQSGDISLKTLEEENKLVVDEGGLPVEDTSSRQCLQGTDKKGIGPSGKNQACDISSKTLEEGNELGVDEGLDIYHELPAKGNSFTQCLQDTEPSKENNSGGISLKATQEDNKKVARFNMCHDLLSKDSLATKFLQASEENESNDISLKTLRESKSVVSETLSTQHCSGKQGIRPDENEGTRAPEVAESHISLKEGGSNRVICERLNAHHGFSSKDISVTNYAQVGDGEQEIRPPELYASDDVSPLTTQAKSRDAMHEELCAPDELFFKGFSTKSEHNYNKQQAENTSRSVMTSQCTAKGHSESQRLTLEERHNLPAVKSGFFTKSGQACNKGQADNSSRSIMTSQCTVKGHSEHRRLPLEEGHTTSPVVNASHKTDSCCLTVKLKSKRKSTPIKCDFNSKKPRIFLTQKQMRRIPQSLIRPLPTVDKNMEVNTGIEKLDDADDKKADRKTADGLRPSGDDKFILMKYSNGTNESGQSVLPTSFSLAGSSVASKSFAVCDEMEIDDSNGISTSLRFPATSQFVSVTCHSLPDVIRDCNASSTFELDSRASLDTSFKHYDSPTVVLEKLETVNLHKRLPIRPRNKRFLEAVRKPVQVLPKPRLRVTLTQKDLVDEEVGAKKLTGILNANGIKVRDDMPIVICKKLKTIVGKGPNKNGSLPRVAKLRIRTSSAARTPKTTGKDESCSKTFDLTQPRQPDFRYVSKRSTILASFDSRATTCCFCHLPANHLLGLGDLFGPYRPLAEEVLARQDSINEHLNGSSSGNWGRSDPAHSRDGSPMVSIDKDEETCFLTARVEADDPCVDGSSLGDITRAISRSSHHLRSVSTIEHVLQDAGNRSWQKKQCFVQNLPDGASVRIPGPKSECKVISHERVKNSPHESENGNSSSKTDPILPNINSIVFLEPKINFPHADNESIVTSQNSPFTPGQRSPRGSRKAKLKCKNGTPGQSGGPSASPSSLVQETSTGAAGDSTSVCISHKFNTGPMWTHGYCAMWADGVYAIRGQLYGLWDAARSSTQILCVFCRRPGATIVSFEDKMDYKIHGVPLKVYHYPCALSAGLTLNWETLTANRR